MKKSVSQQGSVHPGISPDGSMLPLWLRMEREYNTRILKWDLPFNVSITLLKLHMRPEISEPAALAEANCLPRQTMTFILDALEKKKLARRTPHPKDRRRKLIHLTAKGRKLAAAIYQDLVAFESHALQALGKKQLLTLHRLIARYNDTLAAENSLGIPK